MSGHIINWPGDYTGVAFSANGSSDSIGDDGSGEVSSWSFSENWTRVRFIPSGGVHRYLPFEAQLDPQQCVISCMDDGLSAPVVAFKGHPIVGADYNPLPVSCGSVTRFAEGGVVIETKTLYGQVTGLHLEHNVGIDYPEEHSGDPPEDVAPSQTITLEDISGIPVFHQEQQVYAGAIDSPRAMLGSIKLKWIEPSRASGGGRTFYFTVGMARIGNATVNQTTPLPTWEAWDRGTAYLVGDVVSYSGLDYNCIAAHLLTSSEDTPHHNPALRPDLWRLFDIFNHVGVFRIANGARFAFLGRYREESPINGMVIVEDNVKGYTVVPGHDRASMTYVIGEEYDLDGETHIGGSFFFGGGSGTPTVIDPVFGNWAFSGTNTGDDFTETFGMELI